MIDYQNSLLSDLISASNDNKKREAGSELLKHVAFALETHGELSDRVRKWMADGFRRIALGETFEASFGVPDANKQGRRAMVEDHCIRAAIVIAHLENGCSWTEAHAKAEGITKSADGRMYYLSSEAVRKSIKFVETSEIQYRPLMGLKRELKALKLKALGGK